jgi:hypothetical protein
MNMPSNIASLAITARARLIAALANPLIQAEADDANVTVAFGTPKVVAVDGKNTSITSIFTRTTTVNSVTTTETVNSVNHYYNRNPIGEFLTVQMTTGATPAPIRFNYTSASTYAELLILILAHYGVAFEAGDIVDGSFTGIPTLTAAPDSIGWTGSFTFPEFVAHY